ncbi:glycoside hydrolase family, partial [Brachionus plicatilis]
MFKIFFLTISFLSLYSKLQSCDIEDFGAVSNDRSYIASIQNGIALKNCFQSANSSSDRTVLVKNDYSVIPDGVIYDLVDVTLQLDGVIRVWDADHTKWPNDTNNKALALLALTNTQGLVIKGNGVIHGNGYSWWWSVIINGHDNRPNLMDIKTSKDTLVEGITVMNAPQYHINFMDTLNLTIQHIKILVNITDLNVNESAPIFPLNTDGIDVRGKNVLIRNITVENFDDAVAVKPTHKNQAVYSDCTENIIIEDCYVKYGVGMSMGSVPPNENLACIRNVTIRNVKFDTPLKAIYIKPNPGQNGMGLISNIVYENIEIIEPLWWAIYIGTQQQKQPYTNGTGCSFFFPLPGTECPSDPLVTVEDITLRNVSIYGGLLSPGIMRCHEKNPCKNLIFDGVNVYNRSLFPIENGYLCENFSGHAKN